MKKATRALVVSMTAMTPAFILDGTAQVAAHPTPNDAAQSSRSTNALDREALKSVLLTLSAAEKLRIAGDRIRLSANALQGGSSSQGAAHPPIQSNTNPIARCTIATPGTKGPPQGPTKGSLQGPARQAPVTVPGGTGRAH